jgi:proline racemase
LAARGLMQVGDELTSRSIIEGEFTGRIADQTDLHGTPAIIPEISGRGWVTGTHQHMLDPSDPWPEGYKLSDTWGAT